MEADATKKVLPYGRWESVLSAEAIFSSTPTISYLRPGRNGVFFLQAMVAEQNDVALMYLSGEGHMCRISPVGVSVRSRVHEYGCLPYVVTGQAVYYSTFRTGVVYRQSFDEFLGTAGQPYALTPAAHDLRYADFVVDTWRRRLLCIREDHRTTPPANALVAIDLEHGGEGVVLFADSDFVASPCLSAHGEMLAFQAWSHPDMPWDNTSIYVARFDAHGNLANLQQVVPDRRGSLVQPGFNARDDLYFLADWSDWWNLYRIEAADLCHPEKVQPVFPIKAECCAPQWQTGQHNYAFAADERVLLSVQRECSWELVLLDPGSQHSTIVADNLGLLEHVFFHKGNAIYLAADSLDATAIHQSLLSYPKPTDSQVLFAPAPASAARLAPEQVAMPEHFSYPVGAAEGKDASDGQIDGQIKVAYGIFYRPCNPACMASLDTLPPLLVFVHGGPTSSARLVYNPVIQFWTSRGFAVLDVNHRGSSGYGRCFRRSLYGEWGVTDISDVFDGVAHLVANGKVAPDKLAIRGSSAGGYAVLAALVQSKIFSAGTSYYGIGNLASLAADTHKFESRYLEQLIGPWPEASATYAQRSPLNHIDCIRAPVLLLQGGEDKVVPPNQAEQLFVRLKERNPATRYVYFPDEGHGFRKPQNQVAALNAELAFYEDVLL